MRKLKTHDWATNTTLASYYSGLPVDEVISVCCKFGNRAPITELLGCLADQLTEETGVLHYYNENDVMVGEMVRPKLVKKTDSLCDGCIYNVDDKGPSKLCPRDSFGKLRCIGCIWVSQMVD